MKKEDDDNVKEQVKIRYKELKKGGSSIYLDCYVNGIREYKFLNLYLKEEKSRADKLWNKEQVRLGTLSRHNTSSTSRMESTDSRTGTVPGN